jgi:tRNA threonylcarbamoyl adenosine modification protein YeaZ
MDRPFLAIDTSGSYCSVALQGRDGSLVFRHSIGEGDHFEQLPGLVRAVCSEASLSIADLSHLRVGIGPGSFTGIRIGMSFAKGLAWSSRIPCVGVCSFLGAALAQARIDPVDGRVTVIADARRLEVFYGVYDSSQGRLTVVSPPQLLGINTLVERAGQGGQHVTPQRDFAVPGLVLRATAQVAIGLLGAEIPAETFSVARIARLEPSYIREVSAKTIEQRRMGA